MAAEEGLFAAPPGATHQVTLDRKMSRAQGRVHPRVASPGPGGARSPALSCLMSEGSECLP